MPPDDAAQAIAGHLMERHAEEGPAARSLRAQPDQALSEEVPEAFDYLGSMRFLRWYDGLLRSHVAIAGALADANTQALSSKPDAEHSASRAVRRALLTVHRILLAYPTAAKAAYGALVAEGRAYARTEEGQELRERLCASPHVTRAALLWRSLTLGMLVEDEASELPSTYLDNVLRLAEEDDLPAVLGRLARPGKR
jgi:hypothetical protein